MYVLSAAVCSWTLKDIGYEQNHMGSIRMTH